MIRKKVIVVVDMQNDFKTGALGSEEAKRIARKIADYIRSEKENAKREGYVLIIVFTKDTHHENYLETQEGKNLPVEHTIEGTWGWMIVDELKDIADESLIFCKETFGSIDLAKYLQRENFEEALFCGVCTCLCVITNILMGKAFAPETIFTLLAALCACVSARPHRIGIEAMRTCQVNIVGGPDPDSDIPK